MSRAFVKEDAGGDDDALPERARSGLPNYVTPRGKRLLEESVAALEKKVKSVSIVTDDEDLKRQRARWERDLRYFQARVESAILVDHSAETPKDIRLGAEVRTVDPQGGTHRFQIVGEDEADADEGRICWSTPLADTLLGKKAGDTARWERPTGTLELRIESVSYSA